MPDRYTPKLDNYYLDIISTRDDFESSLAIHEIPYSNKNKIDDHGQRPRRIYVECSFQENPALTSGWNMDGDVVLPTYIEHFFFLEYIKSTRKNFTFTHPKYGEILGKIKNITSYHDDTNEYVKITFDFIEEIQTEEITFVRYIIPEMASGWTGTNTTLTETIGLAEKEAVNAVQFDAYASALVSDFDSYLNQLSSPTNSIINTINYGTTLPGQIIQSINGAIDRIVVLYQTGRNAPASFINNIIAGVRELKATFSGVDANYVHIMGASRVAYESGIIYDEDDQNYKSIRTKEESTSFDYAGNYKGAATLPEILTITELEFSLYQVRELINEAILIDRNNRSLQEQARKLQDYVNEIKLNRDRIEAREYSLRTMHEITRDVGLTYHAAERILGLNPQIHNPTFTNGEINVLMPVSE